jgi:hypothetical protein
MGNNHQTYPNPYPGVLEQAGELLHDLTSELREEIHDLPTGE